MSKGFFPIIIVTSVMGFLFPLVCAAEEVGVVMDVSGKVDIHRQGKNISVDFGMNIQDGDVFTAESGSSVTVVTYVDCREWIVNGPQRASISGATLVAITGQGIESQRQLPVCYSPSDSKSGKSDLIGGLVLRGAPKDPVKELREEFVTGKASNATLMTLIMNDLKTGKKDTAKVYYEELHKRAPRSQFVMKLAEEFRGDIK